MIQYLEKAVPNQGCLVTNRSDLPVVDFGVYAQGLDPRLVISIPVLTEVAEELGFVRREVAAEKDDHIAALEDRIARLEEEATEYDTVIQAIDSIESAGFRARKKPGRKPEVAA